MPPLISLITIRSREPTSIVKPLKTANPTPEAENKQNEKLEAAKPKAVRHLILVRHGQYNLNGATDAQRFLTDVGRQQAEFTGERLKALEIPWERMVKSTMQRAQETGKIIAQKVGDAIPTVDHCSLIEEGAPIAPEPPIGHWRPEPSVCAHMCIASSISVGRVCTRYWLSVYIHTLTSRHSSAANTPTPTHTQKPHSKIPKTNHAPPPTPSLYYTAAVLPGRRPHRGRLPQVLPSRRAGPGGRLVHADRVPRERDSVLCVQVRLLSSRWRFGGALLIPT